MTLEFGGPECPRGSRHGGRLRLPLAGLGRVFTLSEDRSEILEREVPLALATAGIEYESP